MNVSTGNARRLRDLRAGTGMADLRLVQEVKHVKHGVVVKIQGMIIG